jgi:hypothetical protein
VIRERCGCGGEFETDEPEAMQLLDEWREWHQCPAPVLPEPIGGTAQVETAPDYTIPELHLGFRV